MKIHPKSYSLGYVRGCSDERDQYRVAAFGAIRRAAEIARDLDEYAEYQADSGTNPTTAPAFRYQAREVRRAIRAAIGSEKKP